MKTSLKVDCRASAGHHGGPLAGLEEGVRRGPPHGVRVPVREIALSPTRHAGGRVEDNAPVRVYDTSGPYTDPSAEIDLRAGLQPMREGWIDGRGDVVRLTQAELGVRAHAPGPTRGCRRCAFTARASPGAPARART